MKQSLRELEGFTIEIKDGTKGRVRDFLFDEKRWVIRYLEGKFTSLQPARNILIPRVFLKPPVWDGSLFPTELTKIQIDKCPELRDHLPVSRKYEEELNRHYKIAPYWSAAYFGPMGNYYPPRPLNVPSKAVEEDDIDTILRSFNEVRGYHIEALDGRIGHIDDLIIDDIDWQVVYAVVDTSNWLPWSKKVLIAIEWMDKISYVDGLVKINLKIDTIKKADEYQPALLKDDKYDKVLYDFYTRSLEK